MPLSVFFSRSRRRATGLILLFVITSLLSSCGIATGAKANSIASSTVLTLQGQSQVRFGGSSASAAKWIATTILPKGVDEKVSALTCISPSLCLVGGNRGTLYEFNSTINKSQSVSTFDKSAVTGISCSLEGLCLSQNADRGFVVFDNTGGVLTKVGQGVLPSPLGSNSISCSGAANCLGVDRYGRTYIFSSGIWTKGTSQNLPNNAKRYLSCFSPGLCLSIDSLGNTRVLSNNDKWGVVEKVNLPKGTVINGLSCANSSFCMATDSSGQSLSFVNGIWYGPTYISGSKGAAIMGISCSSRNFCIAIDRGGFVYRYAFGRWHQRVRVDAAKGASLNGVTCVGPNLCILIDNKGRSFVSRVFNYSLSTLSSGALGSFVPLATRSSSSPAPSIEISSGAGGAPTVSSASFLVSGSTVIGNTTSDPGMLGNIFALDSVPFNWMESEYWKVDLTTSSTLTLTYVTPDPSSVPLLQLVGPDIANHAIASASGLNFSGVPDGSHISSAGSYTWNLKEPGVYVIALGLGNLHGSSGPYKFSLKLTSTI
ncbi:hypothetical protein [Acidithrix sp. C25]|uniref:hypothetical protein n=1 Tax=Acidithrix sp. C25 TaxID=1671482 RepID=UPI00191B94DB|nr:hypothetical protein [Acidithrix sp. C25]CAG4911699.1 unnamed protein product [Acidithrix sp. C25]